jgi:hypothetical protein
MSGWQGRAEQPGGRAINDDIVSGEVSLLWAVQVEKASFGDPFGKQGGKRAATCTNANAGGAAKTLTLSLVCRVDHLFTCSPITMTMGSRSQAGAAKSQHAVPVGCVKGKQC